MFFSRTYTRTSYIGSGESFNYPVLPLLIMATLHHDLKTQRLVFRGEGDSVKTFLMRLGMLLHLNPLVDDDKKKIAFTSSYLEGGALLWFEHMMNEVSIDEIDTTFDQFKIDLQAAFLNPLDDTAARLELAAVKFTPTKDMTVAVFASTVFNPIALRLVDESPKALAFAFAAKLPPAMQAHVLQQVPETLAEALNAARIYESSFSLQGQGAIPAHVATGEARAGERGPTWEMFAEFAAAYGGSSAPSGRRNQDHGGSQWRGAPRQAPWPRMTEADRARCFAEQRCFKCKSTGHQAKSCRKPASLDFPS